MSIQQANRFHPLPVIGHPDSFYVKQIQQADQAGDVHARESYKVGRYVTLAMNPMMPWEEKLRHFLHALKRHCVAPAGSSEDVMHFYEKLAHLVRRHAAQEAVRMIAKETDAYRRRQFKGESPQTLKQECQEIRARAFGDVANCPEWMLRDSWEQIHAMCRPWS